MSFERASVALSISRRGDTSAHYRRLVFITTFNEWYEGTAVEPGMTRRLGSRDYRFDYLEAIRDVSRNGWCR